MNKKDEALKLALEALEECRRDPRLKYEHPYYDKAITAIREALADSALDRMAENARELGLDYEPPCKTGSQCTNKCQQCEQPEQPSKPLTDESIKIMREMLKVQGQHGNWNYDSYMHGLYNGMEYMVALVEKREPQFRDAPETWLAKYEVKRNNFNNTEAIEAAHGIMSVPDGKENT